jgi:hypothetical protein
VCVFEGRADIRPGGPPVSLIRFLAALPNGSVLAYGLLYRNLPDCQQFSRADPISLVCTAICALVPDSGRGTLVFLFL